MTRRPLLVVVVVAALVAAASVAVGSASSMTVQPQKITRFTVAPSDTVAPSLTVLELFDVNANGKVDRVIATFSETLAAYSAGNAPWTVANVPSGGTLSSVSVSGTQATLTLTEGVGAANTAVGTMTVALAQSATGIRDAAGNQSSFTATAPVDKAGPVPTTVGTTNNGGKNGAGKLQSNDNFWVVFSEGILPTSVPLTSSVTMADPAGAVTIDTLSIPGITSGAFSTGGSTYVSTDGAQATFSASGTGVYTGSTVYATVGAVCTGSCGALGQGSGAFVYVPASTLTDAASNAATGSYAAPSGTALF